MQPLIFKERVTRSEKGLIVSDRLIELHLYSGNHCNRACSFCTVYGSPQGWYQPYTEDHLQPVLSHVVLDDQATVKFYGGEPTLDLENLVWAIGYLREQGWPGSIVIYSNGILASRLIQLLEADPLRKTTASLNYSITTGDGAPPMPSESLALLEAYEAHYPGSIAIGHADILDAGRGQTPFQGAASRAKESSKCPRCYPVFTTQGIFKACPFAVELQSEYFDLGSLETPPAQVANNFKRFLSWLDHVHEPFATEAQQPACHVCHHFLEQLPPPDFEV